MNKLIEKIKGLDKKILIAVCAAVVLVIAAIVALVIFLATRPDSEKPDGDPDKIVETTDAEDTTEADTTEEDTTAEDTTEADTTEADTTEADTTEADTTVPQTEQTGNWTGTTQNQDTTVAVTNPSGEEIIGQGSKDNPFLEIPVVGTGSMSVTTVAVPAGKSLFYSIYRVGGMVVTINNPNAYVVCNGTRYDAKNGVVSFIAPAALASDSVSFEIGNKGGAAASFTLVFTNLTGTHANPAIVSSIGSNVTISLSAGDSDGYVYKYKAAKTGKLRFTLTASVDSIISVTNNRNSAQRNSESDMADGTNYIEIDVNAGDELIIILGSKPDRRGNYPAANITWKAEYV